MKRAHLVIAAAAVSVVGAVLAVWATRETPTVVSTEIVAPVEAPPAVVAETPEAKCDFAGDDTLAWRLKQETRATVKLNMMGAPQLANSSSVSGSSMTLQVKPIRREGQGVVLLAAYRSIQGAAGAMPEFNQPFLMRVSPTCEIVGFARAADTEMATARAQQALLHELQWRFSAERTEMQGENGLGAWQAISVAVATPGHGVMSQRRITSYSTIWETGEQNVVPQDSLLTVERNSASAWFEKASVREALTTRTVDTVNSLSATRVTPIANVFDGVSGDDARYIWEDLLPQNVMPHQVREVTAKDRRDREAVKDLTVEQSVNQYVERVKRGVGIADTWPPLTAYLEAHPEATPTVIKHLKTDMPAEATMGAYIALGRARTPEALNALLEIKRDSAAPTFERARAMFSLVDRDDVGVSLAREFKEDSQSLLSPSTRGSSTFGSESLLALTTMSGLRGNPEVKAVALEAVYAALPHNEEARTLAPVFRAMANIGDPALLSTVAPYTSSPDRLIRRDAAIVFRRLPIAASLPMALEWLHREPDEMVRRHIYQTLELETFDNKEPTPKALVQQAAADLATQPSLMQRKALIRLLARAEELTPAIREQLKAQARLELADRTGLVNSIAKLLSAEDLSEVVP